MDLGLNGKAALVGGSSKGIGRSVAIGLARAGCNVGICARDNAALAETAQTIRRDTDAEVYSRVCDMARYEEIKRVVRETVDTFGRLDILVNNAGGPRTGTFDEMDETDWLNAINQNLMSAIRTTREALPYLRRAGGGRIINIASIAVKAPIDRLILSNTARLGLIGMAKTLSRELAPEGITVNNVCPGNIATERLITLIEERAQKDGISMEEAIAIEERRGAGGPPGGPGGGGGPGA